MDGLVSLNKAGIEGCEDGDRNRYAHAIRLQQRPCCDKEKADRNCPSPLPATCHAPDHHVRNRTRLRSMPLWFPPPFRSLSPSLRSVASRLRRCAGFLVGTTPCPRRRSQMLLVVAYVLPTLTRSVDLLPTLLTSFSVTFSRLLCVMLLRNGASDRGGLVDEEDRADTLGGLTFDEAGSLPRTSFAQNRLNRAV
jgi:hypothetical protein